MKKAKRTCGDFGQQSRFPDTQRVNDTIIYKLCLFFYFLFFLFSFDAVSRRKKQSTRNK